MNDELKELGRLRERVRELEAALRKIAHDAVNNPDCSDGYQIERAALRALGELAAAEAHRARGAQGGG